MPPHRLPLFGDPVSPIIVGLLLMLFLPICGASQNQRPHLTFERFSVEQGLSHSQVQCVYQDRIGFLWVGTDNGLSRYDGYAFKVYRHDPNDSTSISNGWVRNIFEDSYGFLWLSTTLGGLSRYDRKTDRFRRYENHPDDPTSLSGNSVGPVYEDRSGRLWICTDDINRYDRQSDRFVRYNAGLGRSPRSNAITFLFQDDNGTFWVGTWRGLHTFDPETRTFRRVLSNPGDPESLGYDYVSAYADDGNVLWLGTAGGGLVKLDKRSGKSTRFRYDRTNSLSLGNDDVSAIYKDKKGMLWIGTWQYGGLNLFDPKRPGKPVFYRFRRDLNDSKSLSENRIFSICEDRSGNIWIATHKGLNKVSRTGKFYHFLLGRQIRAMQRDSRGRIWIGTMGEGVTVLGRNRRIIATYNHDNQNPGSISSNFIFCFYEDRHGNMWIGTYEKGLNKLARGRDTFVRYRHGQVDSGSDDWSVVQVIEDKTGTFWVTPFSGAVESFNGIAFTRHPNPSWQIFEDGRGGIWVFDSEGLARFESQKEAGTKISYDMVNMSPERVSQITAVKMDLSGILWFTVNEWGLVGMDPRSGTFRHYNSKDGLAHNFVYTMQIDRDGCLWISTENGLSRFDPHTEKFRNFTIEDGLPSNNFYAGQAFMTDDGEMFFGTTNGVISFFPDDLKPVGPLPNVVMTGFYTLHRPFSLNQDASEIKEIEITYRENVFSFEAAVLDFTNPAKNQYAYIMEGFDKDWTHAGTRRYITYTNLDPGTYTLRVKGANSDGFWSEAGTTMKLTITPPFWLEWWFLSALGVLVLGFVVYLYNWRVNKLLEIERTRDQIARDLHDDVASTLSSIALYSTSLGGKLRKSKPETTELVEKIGSLSLEAVDSMSDIVWSLASRHNTLNEMLVHMRDLASQVCTTNGIEYSIDIHPLNEERQLDVGVTKNIYLIFKEALNNMLKHARATSTFIEIGVRDGWFELSLRDNGKGFIFVPRDETGLRPDLPRGHGLRNMEYRARQINAELSIRSTPLKGTTIVLRKRMT